MLAVIDANIVFSALVGGGRSFQVFESNKVFAYYEFIAPEYLLTEMDDKWGRLLSYTHLSKEELSDAYSFIKSQIRIISSSEFIKEMPEAKKLNPDDAPYLALAIKLSCPIISGDKKLGEQNRVEIIPPTKAVKLILSPNTP